MITRLKQNIASLFQLSKKRKGTFAIERKTESGRESEIFTSLLDMKRREAGGSRGAVSNRECH